VLPNRYYATFTVGALPPPVFARLKHHAADLGLTQRGVLIVALTLLDSTTPEVRREVRDALAREYPRLHKA
jgi:hypothetical protein